MWVKAVNWDYTAKDGKTKFKIGEEYSSPDGHCFCNSAYATIDYFEYPLETRYLEVECLSDMRDLGDGDSFRADKIRIVREIGIKELKQDPLFNSAYMYFLKQKPVWKRVWYRMCRK